MCARNFESSIYPYSTVYHSIHLYIPKISIHGMRDFNRPACNRHKARYKAMAAPNSSPGPDVRVAIQLAMHHIAIHMHYSQWHVAIGSYACMTCNA